MTRHELAADEIADAGSALGVGLWTALQTVSLNDRRDAFESALQVIVQSVRGREQANLVEAYGMLALIDQFKHRTYSIKQAAEDAYWDYVRFLRAEAFAEAADWRADVARDERLMGDAA